MSKNETLKWLESDFLKNKLNINVDSDIKNHENHIRGIYGFFINDSCIYVGKSESIYYRMFSSSNKGHIYELKFNLLEENLENRTFEEKDLQSALIEAIDKKMQISIKILEKVPLKYDNYYKDMQRLASSENKYIDKYQKMDQCLKQLPSGRHVNQEIWNIQKEAFFNE